MTITTNNIKLLKSERLTDTPDGGGRMTANEVVDGQSNNLFPDVSQLDRVYGRTSLRKGYAAVITPTDPPETYYGAHVIMTDPPDDPLVHSHLFTTEDWDDERVDAANYVEGYLTVANPLSFFTYGNQLAGQRAITCWQQVSGAQPEIGDVIVLSKETGGVVAYEQYVRILAIETWEDEYFDSSTQKMESIRILRLDLSGELLYAFPGVTPAKNINYTTIPTVCRDTVVADAAKYYGVKPLAQAASMDDHEVDVGSLMGNLVPATQAETPILDQLIGGESSITISAGARDVTVSKTRYTHRIEVTQQTRQYNYTTILSPMPGAKTLVVSYLSQGKWYTLTDTEGDGTLSGTGAGTINYQTGSVLVTVSEMPDVPSDIVFQWGTGIHYSRIYTADAKEVSWETRIGSGAGIVPGTVTVTWTVGGAGKTATDNGSGAITGDATGTIDYVTGRVTLTPALLPEESTAPAISWQEKNVVSETPSPGDGGGGLVTLQAANAIEPGTLVITWESDKAGDEYLASTSGAPAWMRPPGATGDTGAPFAAGAYNLMELLSDKARHWAKDDGSGHIFVSGLAGSVNYLTGEISFYPQTKVKTAAIYRPFSGVGPPYTSYTHGAVVNCRTYAIRYAVKDSTGSAHNGNLPALDKLLVELSPASNLPVVPNSIGFELGGYIYEDRDGYIYYLPAGGGSELAGSIDYASGYAEITLWQEGVAPEFSLSSGLKDADPVKAGYAFFRTAGRPLRPASLTISAVAYDGQQLISQSDLNGEITGDLVRGAINYETGIVEVDWGEMVKVVDVPAEEQSNEWYDESHWELIEGINYVFRPIPVYQAQARYNCVAYSYLPLDAGILGLDPTRLPQDGRVPVYRRGDVVVIHYTDTITDPTPTDTETVVTGYVRLASVDVRDANGALVATDRYGVNLDMGTATWINVQDLPAPLTIRFRVEDMALLTDVQINGTLTLSRGLTHAFPLGSYCSGALLVGDLFARYYNMFDQQTWTGVWSDERIGSEAPVAYNDTLYPLEVTNKGAITERWRIEFTSSAAFKLVGEYSGQIAVGNINEDFAPINPAWGVPYFTMRALGWGTGWAVGNVVRFNTVGANWPVWLARTVLQGPATEDADRFEVQIRGDVDA